MEVNIKIKDKLGVTLYEHSEIGNTVKKTVQAAIAAAGTDQAALDIANANLVIANDALTAVNITKAEHLATASKSLKSAISTALLAVTVLDGAILDGANLAGVDFSGFGIHNASMGGVDFLGAIFTGSDFTGTVFHGSFFNTCDFSFGKFTGCSFRGVLMDNCIAENADFTSADFTGSNFTTVDTKGVVTGGIVLDSSVLKNTVFNDSDLQMASLLGVTAEGVSFIRADMTNSSLKGSYLSKSNFSFTILLNGYLNGCEIEMLCLKDAITSDSKGENVVNMSGIIYLTPIV